MNDKYIKLDKASTLDIKDKLIKRQISWTNRLKDCFGNK